MTLTVNNIDRAMKASPYNEAGTYFHCDPQLLQIIEQAASRGYILRTSHTQAEWTESGLEKAMKELTIKEVAEKPESDNANDHYQQFTGGDNFFAHKLNRNILYTEGVRQMAEDCGAYWLIDIIASYQYGRVKSQPFQTWKLTLNKTGNGAKIVCEDGNENKIVSQRIPFTVFKYKEATLWCVDGTILLPSEY